MTEQLFYVRVNYDDGSRDEWHALTKDQANYIYSQQVEIHGEMNTQTGKHVLTGE